MKSIHNIFFVFGVFYYLVLPVIVGQLALFYDEPAMASWHANYSEINIYKLFYYVMFIGLLIISFVTGSMTKDRIDIKQQEIFTKAKKRSFYPGISIIFILMLIILIIFYYLNYEGLFTGYQLGYDYMILGQVATLNMISLFFFLFFLLNKQRGFSFYLISFNFFLSSIFLLSYGTRMYILISLCAIFLYKNKYSNSMWSLKRIFIYILLSMFLLLAVGIWRQGLSLSYRGLVFIFYAEPVFTWWSASTYLARNNIELIAIPLNYIASFINFIPTVVFPDKADYIYSLENIVDFSSPLGATNIIVPLIANFGVIFSAVFVFFMGMFYSYIKKISCNNNFFKIYYMIICSVLPFQFFRDGFAVFNKQIFFNLYILPLTFLSFNSMFARLRQR